MFIAGAFRRDPSGDIPSLVEGLAGALSHRGACPRFLHAEGCSLASAGDAAQGPGGVRAVCSGRVDDDRLRSELSLPADAGGAAVAAAAYRRWGDRFAARLSGEFSCAVFDGERRRLLLVRDRIGLCPLYYSWDGQGLAFASEVQALWGLSGSRSLNARALHAYLLFGSVFTEEQLFEGTLELRPGHVLVAEPGGSPSARRYWDCAFAVEDRSPPEAAQRLRSLVTRSIKRRLPADGSPVGLALSGGIDSTLLLAQLRALHSGPIETYTVCSGLDPTEEHRDAAHAASRFGARHHEIRVDSEAALGRLPEVVRLLGESPSHFATIGHGILHRLIAEEARAHGCRDLFTGNGVELILDGNPPQRWLHRSVADPGSMGGLKGHRHYPPLPALLGEEDRTPWLSLKDADPIEERYVMFNSVWRRERALTRLYTEDFRGALGGYEAESVVSDYLAGCGAEDLFDKLLYLDLKTWNSRRNLVLNERLASASGLSLRIPFLDAELVEFCASLPPEVKRSPSDAKLLVRQAFGGEIPEPILEKGKHGSTLHIDYRGRPGGGIVSGLVGAVKTRGVFLPAFVDSLLAAREEPGTAPYLLALFSLELWFRVFADEPQRTEKSLLALP